MWRIALAIALATIVHAGDAVAQDTILRCESHNYRYAACDVDLERYQVQFARELSRGRRCGRQGAWGLTPDGVFVDNGCRADFALVERRRGDRFGYDRGERRHERRRSRRDVIECESRFQRRNQCPVRIGRRGVELDRVLGRNDCVLGRSWGVYRGGIWVDDNCHAVFSLRRADRGYVAGH